MKKKLFNIEVFFDKNYIICPNIQLVANDYNSIEFNFIFDREEGRKVFKLKKPDRTIWVKEIEDNKIVLVDTDENGKLTSLIDQGGVYEFEICIYDENSKLTAFSTDCFKVRSEVVNVDNDTVSKASELPFLTQLIGQVDSAIKSTNTSASYAKTQGDYAKEQAEKIIDSNNQATSIINDFKKNVDDYTDNFNQNATEKLETYNNNVESKTTSYNQNATQKTNAFNSNATSKTTDFNSNANSKTTEYNTNSSNKIDLFNENATNKMNAYNTNSEQKISLFNTTAEEKINEFDNNANSYGEGIKDNTNRIKRIEKDIFDSGSASDTSIKLQDSAFAEFKKVAVEGAEEQKTTDGKNQFDAQAIKNGTNISVDNNDVISISKTPTSNGFCSTLATLQELCPNLKVGDVAYLYIETDFEWANEPGRLKKLIYVGENWLSGNSKEITESLLNKELILYGGYNTTSTLRVMITKDSYDEDFEPYTGGKASPNLDYPQEIKTIKDNFKIYSTKDNLFNSYIMETDENDPTKEFKIIVKKDGTIEISENVSINGYANTGKKLKELCPNLKKGDTAYLFGTTDFYDNETLKSRIYLAGVNLNWNFGTSKEITEEILNSYVIVYGGYNKTNHIKLAISKDKLLTSYEPYVSSIVEIQIPENEFVGKLDDNTKDLLFIGYDEKDSKYHLYLEKNVGSYQYSINDITSNTVDYNTKNFNALSPINEKIKPDILTINSTSSEHFLIDGTTQTKKVRLIIPFSFLNVSDEESSTISTAELLNRLKSKYGTEDDIIYFPLNEPYELDLGTISMPLTYHPNTNIFTDCSLQPNIEVEYYRDFKNTISILQETQNSIQSQVTENANRIIELEAKIQNFQTVESEVAE